MSRAHSLTFFSLCLVTSYKFILHGDGRFSNFLVKNTQADAITEGFHLSILVSKRDNSIM